MAALGGTVGHHGGANDHDGRAVQGLECWQRGPPLPKQQQHLGCVGAPQPISGNTNPLRCIRAYCSEIIQLRTLQMAG